MTDTATNTDPLHAAREAIDPDLPGDTRDILALLATSDWLQDDWLTTGEIAEKAAELLDWDASDYQRIVRALREVNVVQPKSRPKQGGVRLPRGFRPADIREALDKTTVPSAE